MFNVGTVIIGRNEGDRLRRCLRSVTGADAIVYVDSGSTDGSSDVAREHGAWVVDLDMSHPFSAARARNAGFHEVMRREPDVEYLQFVDGDCELEPNWIKSAIRFLASNPSTAVVCGRLAERHPEQSIYNRLCEMEWKELPGEARSCGGIFMIRREAFEQVDGFTESMIAGEEPEFCQRLRNHGKSIQRLDLPMAAHDAAMSRFSQWWRRAMRAGHAYAQSAALHRKTSGRSWRREIWRNWVGGGIVPLTAVALAWPTRGISLAILTLYPIWTWRIARERQRRFGETPRDAWLYAGFCVLAKFPAALGQCMFWWRRLRGRSSPLIEYKTPETQHVA